MENKKSFYGWKVAAGSFIILAMPFAVIFLSHSIFLTPVTQALGFTATQFSLVFTIVAIATAIMSPIMGKIIRKYDVRYIMALCGAVVSISFAACKRIVAVLFIICSSWCLCHRDNSDSYILYHHQLVPIKEKRCGNRYSLFWW